MSKRTNEKETKVIESAAEPLESQSNDALAEVNTAISKKKETTKSNHISQMKKETTKSIGDRSEDLAVSFLQSRGYDVLHRNYKMRGGEIDIVAKVGATLCFVEVKARKTCDFGAPQEFVDDKKKKRILKTANHYVSKECPDYEALRFDVFEHYIDKEIVHFIPNAFSEMDVR